MPSYVTITFRVEEKDECAHPGPVDPEQVCAVANDLLSDQTRAEWEWSWMITDARLHPADDNILRPWERAF